MSSAISVAPKTVSAVSSKFKDVKEAFGGSLSGSGFAGFKDSQDCDPQRCRLHF